MTDTNQQNRRLGYARVSTRGQTLATQRSKRTGKPGLNNTSNAAASEREQRRGVADNKANGPPPLPSFCT